MADYYKPKKISELNLKSDAKVSLIGTVENILENSFVLNDGEKIEIAAESVPEKGKKVRVFCSVLDQQLKADIIQPVDLDEELFRKSEEFYRKFSA
jgi:hypothetical protein